MNLFFRDRLVDPSLVKQGRGQIHDTGVKAAGYYVRKYVPGSAKIFAMKRAIEKPNFFYYFGREEYAYNDLTRQQTLDKLNELKERIDIVICSKWQAPYIEKNKEFIKRAEFILDDKTNVLLYSKRKIDLPEMKINVSELNDKFDNEFSWNSTILNSFFSKGDKSFGQLVLDSMTREKNKKIVKKHLYFLFPQ